MEGKSNLDTPIIDFLLSLNIQDAGTITSKLEENGYQTLQDLITDPPKSVEQLERWNVPGRWANKIFDALGKLGQPTGKNSVENFIKSGKYTPRKLPRVRNEFYERESSVHLVAKYISDVKMMGKEELTEKFPLLGTSGMKGIGKTELLRQLCHRHTELGVEGTFYFNFNGGTDTTQNFMEYFSRGKSCRESFACELLRLCGVDRNIAQQFDFYEAMAAFRTILKLDNNQTLLICVDEIGDLRDDIGQALLSALMSYMDTQKGKVIFVFTHISSEYLLQQSTGSGRPVIIIPLVPLSIDIWKTNPQLKKAAENNPPLYQLLLSCSGHPRSLFEGLPEAIRDNPSLLSDPTEEAISIARFKIIELCKFLEIKDDFIYENLKKWFSSNMEKNEKTHLQNSGLLLTINGTCSQDSVVVFFPLLIQNWARRNSKDNELAYHLQQIYAADAVLGSDSEKKMEIIMYNYEAVQRICLADSPFHIQDIQDYYPTKYCGINLPHLRISRPKLHNNQHLVKKVEDFGNTEQLIKELNKGFILVSKKHSEEGVEYLVPFRDNNDKLVVGAVQCKYVLVDTNWKEINRKMKNVTQDFEEKQIQTFSVVFSTVDCENLRPTTYEDRIIFTEKELFDFTNKLGLLRLHTQKLGKSLRKQYPVLERAALTTPYVASYSETHSLGTNHQPGQLGTKILPLHSRIHLQPRTNIIPLCPKTQLQLLHSRTQQKTRTQPRIQLPSGLPRIQIPSLQPRSQILLLHLRLKPRTRLQPRIQLPFLQLRTKIPVSPLLRI